MQIHFKLFLEVAVLTAKKIQFKICVIMEVYILFNEPCIGIFFTFIFSFETCSFLSHSNESDSRLKW